MNMLLWILLLWAGGFQGSVGGATGPEALRPPGWSTEKRADSIRYVSPDGEQFIIAEYFSGPADPLEAARRRVRAVGGRAPSCERTHAGRLGVCETRTTRQGISLDIRYYMLADRGGLLAVSHLAKRPSAGSATDFSVSASRVDAVLASHAAAAIPEQKNDSAPPVASVEAGEELEQVLFEVGYTGGAGGMILPKYTPVFLFRGGEACRCPEFAPSDIDLASLKRTRSEDTGRWRQVGSTVHVEYSDGDKKELRSDIGPPAPIPNEMLHGHYQALSGGGDIVLGGSTMIVTSNDFEFSADGSFREGTFGGGGNPSVTASSSRSSAGRFAVEGSTLSLVYKDGRTVRTSLYWAKNGDLVGGVPDVVWIGGRSYVLQD